MLEREADHEGIDEDRWVLATNVNGDSAILDVRWRGGRGVLVGTDDVLWTEVARTKSVNAVKETRDILGRNGGETLLDRVPLDHQ